MKFKLLVSAMLLAAASITNAQSITVGYAQRAADTGGQQHLTSMSVRTASVGKFSGDLGISSVQVDATNAITNRTDIGITYSTPLPLNATKFDLRVGHGWKAKSGSETTQYYAIEPSVSFGIPDTKLTARLGYRIREAYSSSVADNSTTTRVSLAYSLTPKDRISFGRDWQRGDGGGIQNTLQYTRAF